MWITRGMFVPHIPPVTHTNPPPAHTTPGKVQGYSDSFSITEFFQKTRWETRIDPIFPIPELVERQKGKGGDSKPPAPVSNLGRADRISKKFAEAISYIQDTPGDPHRVLVIETVGKSVDFHKAVQKIDGLEWLAEIDVDDVFLDDLYEQNSDDYKSAKKEGGRLYLSSSNQQTLQDLQGLWGKWDRNQQLPYGFGAWKYLFTYIADLRFWNEKDRLDSTGIIDIWEDEVAAKSGSSSKFDFDIELHFIKDKGDADTRVATIINHIKSLSGEINKQCRVSEIAFHALKVTLPVSAIEHVLDSREADVNYPEWIKFSGIKYCRPIGQQLRTDIEPENNPLEMSPHPPDDSLPVIALLDGVPMLNHRFLTDYIKFDDPDDFSNRYQPSEQRHGTCMASLICHDDLSDSDRVSISRKIYVRPIMFPTDMGTKKMEKIPSMDFPENLIERAVVRIFDGEGDEGPVCPTVKVINLSVGNLDYQFVREMSTWAKLLDWLSWKYKVLFVVSAGNYYGEVDINGGGVELHKQFIQSIESNQIERKLLSPAESINSLTVGAMHSDFSPNGQIGLSNPYKNYDLPAEYSRNGSGYKQQIKPDILVSGGKMLYQKNANKFVRQSRRDIGQKAAYVGMLTTDITNTTNTSGTSNAAALATHAAAHLFEVLEGLREENAGLLTDQYDALILKSLLVHGASWGDMRNQYEILKNKQNSRGIKRVVAKHLGYGKANFNRVMSCTDTRVTILGFGELSQSERHRFNLNIPVAVTGLHIRMIVTLAWFTPINPFRYGMRQAKLFFDVQGLPKNTRQEADWQQVRKGAVQHEIFNINQFENDHIDIFVQCEADAIDNFEEEIPYAISFTLEAEEETGIDLYTMIKQSIQISV